MVYGCGNKMIKLYLFVTNIVIFAIGTTLLGLATWMLNDANFSDDVAKLIEQELASGVSVIFSRTIPKYHTYLWIAIAIGAMLAIVGFLGCCGASCENSFALSTFSAIVLVLAVIQVATLTMIVVERPEVIAKMETGLVEISKTPRSRKLLASYENLFKCCGATADTQVLYKEENQCTGELLENAPDCLTVFEQKIDLYVTYVLVTGLCVLIIQTIAIVFSCVLVRTFIYRSKCSYTIDNIHRRASSSNSNMDNNNNDDDADDDEGISFDGLGGNR